MSLKIIKAGILDTIQDQGRYGYQHLGINPGGAMDKFSSQLANALLGKDLNAPVMEMYFPPATILFDEEMIICITGGDFSPTINQKPIPLHQPIFVNKKTVLRFGKKISGSICYLATLDDFRLKKWLNSYSTNIVAFAGGYKGRALKKEDEIDIIKNSEIKKISQKDFYTLPWIATETIRSKKEIRFIKGNEWNWLSNDAIENFTKNKYAISNNSNRMGYRLTGEALHAKEKKTLISSGVTFGTIQLLPTGQLIILMADHQTTGGYPRIAHVISADLPALAQCSTAEEINFKEIEIVLAQELFINQQRELLQIQTAAKFKMESFLHD
jgi:antagonist of KipI